MFLFSTIICQIVLTTFSEFPTAIGMMMVENIPFLHVMCNAAIDAQGMGTEAFATVFVAYALASVAVGLFFYLLGHFKLGNAVYFFPKHVIVGCIGGIGIFILTTGFEVATNVQWRWTFERAGKFCTTAVFPLWATSLALELGLRLALVVTKMSLLPPFYFVAIPPFFYLVLFVCRVPLEAARANGESRHHTSSYALCSIQDASTLPLSLFKCNISLTCCVDRPLL